MKITPRKGGKKKVEPEQNAEMQVARGRLRGFLNEIMEPEASSSSAAVVAPAKVAMRGRPKRQRRESSGTGNKPSLIKLFDRLVNVSQYDENSPLYPICREWFYNRKTEGVKETSTGDANPTYYTGREPLLKQLQKGRIDRVAALPPPNDLEVPKIPFCEPPSMGNGLDLFTTDYDWENPTITTEELTVNYLDRWRKVRQFWAEQSYNYFQRYSESCKVLEAIKKN